MNAGNAEVGSIERARVVPAAPPTFDQIYALHFDMVWRAARRLGTPPANIDDVVQDVFLVLYRRLSDYTDNGSVRSWIYGIVVRVVRDHRRRFRRKDSRWVPLVREDNVEIPVASPGPVPSEIAERNEALALVCTLLDELSPDKRELFVLSELEEMTVREIAEALNVHVQTIYSRLRVARKAFDDALARHNARTGRRSA